MYIYISKQSYKETYTYIRTMCLTPKRDLYVYKTLVWHFRHARAVDRFDTPVKRDLHKCQKRPIYMSKET